MHTLRNMAMNRHQLATLQTEAIVGLAVRHKWAVAKLKGMAQNNDVIAQEALQLAIDSQDKGAALEKKVAKDRGAFEARMRPVKRLQTPTMGTGTAAMKQAQVSSLT